MKKLALICVLALGLAFGQGWEYASLVIGERYYGWFEPGLTIESSQPALLYRDMTGGGSGPTDDHFTNVLNEAGQQGWELVGPVAIDGELRMLFKRSLE